MQWMEFWAQPLWSYSGMRVQYSAVHQAESALSVQLLLHVHYFKSTCSVRTGYVFFGTLVSNCIWGEPELAPHWLRSIMLSIYLSIFVSFTPRLSHSGSWDPCTPWNALCIPVYWRALMYDLQQQGQLKLLVSAVKIINEDRYSRWMHRHMVWTDSSYRDSGAVAAQQLASSPGLFFLLNISKGMKETNGQTDKHTRKIGLVFILGVGVHMR